MICEFWDVIVVPFPFTERPGSKRRPALVISKKVFNDNGNTVLAMITTRAHHPWPGDTELQDRTSAGYSSGALRGGGPDRQRGPGPLLYTIPRHRRFRRDGRDADTRTERRHPNAHTRTGAGSRHSDARPGRESRPFPRPPLCRLGPPSLLPRALILAAAGLVRSGGPRLSWVRFEPIR